MEPGDGAHDWIPGVEPRVEPVGEAFVGGLGQSAGMEPQGTLGLDTVVDRKGGPQGCYVMDHRI